MSFGVVREVDLGFVAVFMTEVPDSMSQPMTFDGSLSFLDDLMALEGIGTAELPSMTSSSFAEAPGEIDSSSSLQALEDLPAFLKAPGISSARLPPDAPGYELPDLPMEFGEFDSMPQPEAPSSKERARATQKRFRTRQKVQPQTSNSLVATPLTVSNQDQLF